MILSVILFQKIPNSQNIYYKLVKKKKKKKILKKKNLNIKY